MSNTPLSQGAAFDIRNLDSLKLIAKNSPQQGLKAAAKQMEGMFAQMMLKSMRDASFKDELFDSQQSEMFTSMYDQQISQDIANQGKLGFANLMLEQMTGKSSTESPQTPLQTSMHTPLVGSAAHFSAAMHGTVSGGEHHLDTDKSYCYVRSAGDNDAFISQLISPAMAVSQKSGIPHQLIIAQAVLESGWGNREIRTKEGKPSHNLFGIKATADWKGETTEITTTEYINGIAQKVKAAFRVYKDYAEALSDYASLITNNPRYQNVSKTSSPEQAAHALQTGGYASDPGYAKKLINIIQRVKNNMNHAIGSYKGNFDSLF